VALENQPLFRAPSLPKMGKTTVSSSTFSNVAKSSYKPKLKSTKFQFKSPLQKQKAEKVEQLKGIETANVAATLGETNRILVEIQKQLALDFANRITEKKQLLELSRRSALKQKAVKKEAFVEKGKEKKKFDILQTKVLAPVKGIFDKILDFLALVGTGIVLNTAWEWLSDEKNRQKLKDVFEFLGKNWKIIAGILGSAFLIKKLYGLYKVFDRLRKLIRFFRGPRSKPGLPGTNTPADCSPILNCLKSPAVVAAMANAVAPAVAGILSGKIKPRPVPGGGPAFNLNEFIKGLGGLLFLLDPISSPARAAGRPGELPASEQGKPKPAVDFSDSEAIARTLQELESGGVPLQAVKPPQLKSSHGTPIPPGLALVLAELKEEYARTKKPASRLTPQGFLAVRATSPFNATPEITFNPKLTPESNKAAVQQATALFTVANLPSTLSPLLGSRGLSTRDTQSRAISRVSKQGVFEGFDPTKINTNFIPRTVATPSSSTTSTGPTKTKQVRLTAEQMQEMISRSGFAVKPTISRRSTEIDPGNYPSSKDMMNAAARGESQGLLTPEKSQRMLLQLEKEKLEKLFNMVAVGKSMGGLIGGVPSMVDTIPAMLAKGEFIMNSMSTKLFKPFLYAINANAGELFNDFIEFTTKFVENVNKKFDLVNDEFDQNKELAELIYELKEREREKKLKEDGTGGGIGRMTSQSSIKPTPKTTPKTIQTYNVRKKTSSSNGQPTIVNMPMPAVNLAGNQAPESPNTNVHESSSTPISIVSFDTGNPYISEALASYGIFI